MFINIQSPFLNKINIKLITYGLERKKRERNSVAVFARTESSVHNQVTEVTQI